ncbi:MAG: type II secretion system F family protein [Candidatus Electrothrix sp. AUS3]|nr:type II secretion system F family protein [Candidatus Electrothrix gigas]
MNFLKRTIHPTDFADMLRQLGLFLSTGIAPSEAVAIVYKGEKPSSPLAKMLKNMQHDLEQGSDLKDILCNLPKKNLPSFLAEMIRSARQEELPDLLTSISDFIDSIHLDNKKFKAALLYPALVLGTAVLITSMIMIFVIPVFQEMFASMGGSLPTPTQFVVDLSEFVQQNFFFLFFGIVILSFLYKKADKKLAGFNEVRCLIVRNIPLYGKVHILHNSKTFLRTVSFMMASGKTLPAALEATTETAETLYYRNIFLQLHKEVLKGKNLGEVLFTHKLFPRKVSAALTVNSQSTAFFQILNRLEEQLQMQIDRASKTFRSALEPLLLIVIGILISVLVVALYMPIFTMAGTL